MICPPCRGEFFSIIAKKGEPKHDECINDWEIRLKDGQLVKRPEPIRSCACQHKESWNFSISKNEGNDGNGTKS